MAGILVVENFFISIDDTLHTERDGVGMGFAPFRGSAADIQVVNPVPRARHGAAVGNSEIDPRGIGKANGARSINDDNMIGDGVEHGAVENSGVKH